MKVERLPPPAQKNIYPETDIDDYDSIPEERRMKFGKRKFRRFHNSREVVQPLPQQIVPTLLFSSSSASLCVKQARPCEYPVSERNY